MNRYTDYDILALIFVLATNEASVLFCSYNTYAFTQYDNIIGVKKHYIFICTQFFLILIISQPPPSIRPSSLIQDINQQMLYFIE